MSLGSLTHDKALWEKEKVLTTSIFSFSNNVFTSISLGLLKLVMKWSKNQAYPAVCDYVFILQGVEQGQAPVRLCVHLSILVSV